MKKHLLLVLVIGFVLAASGQTSQEVWRESSFKDFVDGTFDDAGANTYVSSKGRIQAANRWDVNGDGNIDILSVNSHSLVEMLDMSIYWGNGKDFSIRNHSYVPADGPMWVASGDLDKDGALDLVVANYSNGTWTDMDTFVYYGGLKSAGAANPSKDWSSYPFKRRIKLPGSNAQKPAIGDFNKDGYPDIVVASSAGFWEYRPKDRKGFPPSRIYWGSSQGFAAGNCAYLETGGATDVAVADLNNDGWLDLAFSRSEGPESFVFFGAAGGFAQERLTRLPTLGAHAVKAGDVNNDGTLDLVFANEKGDVSYAYLNQSGSFSPARRLDFETHAAKDVVIADFNKDGHADIFFSNHQHSLSGDPLLGNRLIDSYLYYGSERGFPKENRKSLQTIGAWGANAADLNNDGWVDLLVCNYQEHYSYEVPSFIYWNGPQGFSTARRTPLYEHGAQGNAIADFDGDGKLDVLITSMMAGSRADYDPSFLYFGNDRGEYTAGKRIELPGREAYEQAFADMDDDGRVDLLLMNQGETGRRANELWIYWNRDNRFSTWNMTGLPALRGLAVEVADLDRNGHLDIVISNAIPEGDPAKGDPSPGSFIYWGGPQGWPVTERTALPIVSTRAVTLCDINGDGHLDLIFGQQGEWGNASIFYGNGTREFPEKSRVRVEGSAGTGSGSVADLNRDGRLDIAFAHDRNVLVYYQQADGSFPKDKSAVLPVQAKTMNIADVNRDGWLDLVCPFYKGTSQRSAESTVLLGGPDGFRADRAIKFPTDGGTGSLVSDFNRDGFPDVFFYCHRSDGSFDEVGKFGDHHVNSLLYWGGSDGFRPDRRLEIPSIGAHYDVGIDLGHIKDRSFLYSYISSPYPANGKRPVKIDWTAETPGKTAVKFQLRVAPSQGALAQAEWWGPQGAGSFFTRPGTATDIISGGAWIQYKAVLDTDNGASSPVLSAVEVTLR